MPSLIAKPNARNRIAKGKNNHSGVYKMYHGTTKAAAHSIKKHGFKASIGDPLKPNLLGKGVSVTRDIKKARRYGPWILRLRVSLGKCRRMTSKTSQHMRRTWHSFGYDSAWIPRKSAWIHKGNEEFSIFKPSRITVLAVLRPRA